MTPHVKNATKMSAQLTPYRQSRLGVQHKRRGMTKMEMDGEQSNESEHKEESNQSWKCGNETVGDNGLLTKGGQTVEV